MSNKLIVAVLAVLGVLGAYAPHADAQDIGGNTNRDGTAGAQYLLVPPTARIASTGATSTGGVQGMNGLEALYQNPAGLQLNTGTSAIFSRMNYPADININYFGVGQRFGNNNIALTVTSWDYGDIPLTTDVNPDPQEDLTFSAQSVVAGLTYSRAFTDRISAGVTTKIVSESIGSDLNASTVGFDAGMSYTVGETGLRFGVSLQNFGPGMEYQGDGLTRRGDLEDTGDFLRPATLEASNFELPTSLNFGGTYTRDFGQTNVTLLGNFRSNQYSKDQYAAGLEVDVLNIVALRGGYSWEQDLADENFYQGWNVGGGLNLDLAGTNVNIDYAYRGTEYFDAVQIVTASVTL